jgi:hypothetical protein
MAMSYGKRKQPGTYHTNKPAGGNYDEGQQSGFGTDKGASNKRSLRNDDGAGGGKFVDTFNDKSGDGHGGGLKKPRAGDA